MQATNSASFAEQLQDVVTEYSNLRILYDGNGAPYLKGVLDVHDDERNVVGHFLIEVHCSEGFPYRFPALLEVGGEIPNKDDWHKYENNRCCITVLPDEIIKCKHGISVSTFVEKHAIPYLANHIYKKLEGKYKNGEYAHGLPAWSQFYGELMKTENKEKWMDYADMAFGKKKESCGRNDTCVCGSGLKFKNCHLKVLDSLRDIGEKEVYGFLNQLYVR
ncbi:MAG: hypothetical protein EP332_04550 [Bacteroidetes bacterium]|nr:MAG: hypothetical protein EP332_04550 [Bacteroidota bacterium]